MDKLMSADFSKNSVFYQVSLSFENKNVLTQNWAVMDVMAQNFSRMPMRWFATHHQRIFVQLNLRVIGVCLL